MDKRYLPPPHWSGRIAAGRRGLVLIVMTVGLAACAARGKPGGMTQIGIDDAAIFGRQVAEFVLPDGSEGSLRQFNGKYSVKFHRYSRVVDIDRAVSVKFKSTSQVDGYSLVILEKAEPNCAKMTELLAIRGSEVRVWDLGNCRGDPVIAINQNIAQFDVPNGKMITRYQFRDGQLRYGDAPYLPPVFESDDIVTPAARQAPAAPAAAAATTPEPPMAASRSKPLETRTASKGAFKSSAPSIPSTMPVFQTKERTPRTIYLDK